MNAGKQALKSLNVYGYAIQMEASSPEGLPDYLHGHLHALVDAPTGGRKHIAKGRWQESWLDALPARLHPKEGGVYVEGVQSLGAYCSYMTKSPFSVHLNDAQLEVGPTLSLIREQQGLKRWASWGSLAA